jgi:hypothetical protein
MADAVAPERTPTLTILTLLPGPALWLLLVESKLLLVIILNRES